MLKIYLHAIFLLVNFSYLFMWYAAKNLFVIFCNQTPQIKNDDVMYIKLDLSLYFPYYILH